MLFLMQEFLVVCGALLIGVKPWYTCSWLDVTLKPVTFAESA